MLVFVNNTWQVTYVHIVTRGVPVSELVMTVMCHGSWIHCFLRLVYLLLCVCGCVWVGVTARSCWSARQLISFPAPAAANSLTFKDSSHSPLFVRSLFGVLSVCHRVPSPVLFLIQVSCSVSSWCSSRLDVHYHCIHRHLSLPAHWPSSPCATSPPEFCTLCHSDPQ